MPTDAVQVTFRFPRSTEIRYLPAPPAAGELVESSSGGVWVVSDVRLGRNGEYIVTCARPTEPPKRARDLALELLRKARGSTRTSDEVETADKRQSERTDRRG